MNETLYRPPRTRSPALVSWLRLMRVFQRVNAASAHGLRCLGLSVGQFDVLAHLGPRRRTTQQHLAQSLLVTKGNISQHLERMEAAGWVARRQVGRTKYLDLTPAGRRLYRKAVPDQEARIDRLFAVLPEHDRGTLADLLRRLDRGIGLKLAELTRPMTT